MCDNNDEYIMLALNISSKPYIVTEENVKAFKRKSRKSEKAVEKWDWDKFEFDKYMKEMK